jgi:signal transduction histidine kinase
MGSGISLANKCLLLFGFAVVVILTAALSVPWKRTSSLVQEQQMEVSRQLSEAWLEGLIQLGEVVDPGLLPTPLEDLVDEGGTRPTLRVAFVDVEAIEGADEQRRFLAEALRRFRDDAEQREHFRRMKVKGRWLYRYARAFTASQGLGIRDPAVAEFSIAALEPALADPLRGVLVVDRTSDFAEGQLLTSRIYIIAAGLLGSLLAVLVFYLILTKLILSPVRELRKTAERVQEGDLAIRSAIHTGDEFQQLSEAFNAMLGRVEASQAQLRSMNESLDLKINELAEANVGLFESNRFKSEFLANVSHELRTPLNSIIGFAELLEEVATGEAAPDPKRRRYLRNILSSGRALLEMINELLDMAKIEAGRMEVTIEATSVTDIIEGLVGIMRPQAEARSIDLTAHLGANVPLIETDPGKLQQILFNFLSNALKFTPEGGTVTISADRVTRLDHSQGVRLAVSDSGPGIAEDMQDLIFEKFRQADGGHTREHPGTGLGLAICKDLAEMLGATVSFVSTPGSGATFYVDMPLTHQPEQPQALMV